MATTAKGKKTAAKATAKAAKKKPAKKKVAAKRPMLNDEQKSIVRALMGNMITEKK